MDKETEINFYELRECKWRAECIVKEKLFSMTFLYF